MLFDLTAYTLQDDWKDAVRTLKKYAGTVEVSFMQAYSQLHACWDTGHPNCKGAQ